MKNLVIVLLLFHVITVGAQTPRQQKNIEAFTRLYGYATD